MAISNLDDLITRLQSEGPPPDQGYLKPGDFHSKNSQAFFGDAHCQAVYAESPGKYKDEVRKVGKECGLAIVYGSSWKLFLEVIPNCSEAQAKTLYNNFLKALPGYVKWADKNIAYAKANEKVHTILGRQVHVDTINSDVWGLKSKGERLARNLPIQGSGGDIIKLVLNGVYQFILKNKLSRFTGVNGFDDFYTRIYSINQDSELIHELEQTLDSSPQGNCKVIIINEQGNPAMEYPTSIQLTDTLISKFNLQEVL